MELLAPRLLVPSLNTSRGNPKSCAVQPVFKPMVEGSNLASWGKKPSANRFHPPRISMTSLGVHKWMYESDSTCTRVGVTVLKLGTVVPPPSASGKLWSLSP